MADLARNANPVSRIVCNRIPLPRVLVKTLLVT